jgi:hypothetical protein
MRAAFYTVEKIGPNRETTPEGFLLCRDVPVARTGEQIYGPGETPLDVGPDNRVIIMRTPEQVFSPMTMGSANGKSFVNEHPYSDDDDKADVNPDNWKELTDGVMLSPRRGEAPDDHLLLVDLLVCDQKAIGLVQGGKVELSLGYEAEYVEDAPGRGRQTNIIVNHVALVEQGRCGRECRIRDHAKTRDSATRDCGCSGGKMKKLTGSKFSSVRDALSRVMKAGDEEKRKEEAEKAEDAIAEAMDAEREEGKKEAEKDGDFISKQVFDAAMKACDAKHAAHDAKFKAHDERLSELEDGETESEADKKATEDALEEEAPEGKGKDARKAKDSAYLSDSHQQTVSMAEIIAPGLHISTFDSKSDPKKTFDAICGLRRKALGIAAATTDGATLIMTLRGGKQLTADSLTTMPCGEIRSLFLATGTAMKNARAADGAARNVASATTEDKKPEDVNERNRKFWSR